MKDTLQTGRCAQLLKVLGEPERLRIIRCLQRGPCHVGALAGLLNTSMVKVSHHLGVLRHAGLVCSLKSGRHVLYELAPDFFQPGKGDSATDYLNLGCCRLEIPRE